MSELTTGWGLLAVGALAWVALSVPVAFAVGHALKVGRRCPHQPGGE